MRKPIKFTDTAIANLPAEAERYEVPQKGQTGLTVRVYPDGHKVFRLHYRFHGKPRRPSLGIYRKGSLATDGTIQTNVDGLPFISLPEAIQKQGEAKALLQAGRDPAAEAVAEHTAAVSARSLTVRGVRDLYIAHISTKKEDQEPTDRRRKGYLATWKEVKRTLDKYLLPKLGNRPIGEVKRRQLLDLIDDMADNNGLIAANRALSWIKRLFKFAAAKDYIDSNPAADIEKPGQEIARKRVLDAAEIVQVWRAAESLPYPTGPYVRALMLTGRRRKSVATMRWSEIDRAKGTWTPSGGTENKQAPELPLFPVLEALLDSLPRREGADYVFRFGTADQPINSFSAIKADLDEAIARVRTADGIKAPMPDWELQRDLRRTVKTGLAEGKVLKEIRDLIMGHSRQGMDKHYDHSERREEKREGLKLWAAHIARLLNPPPSNVTQLPARA